MLAVTLNAAAQGNCPFTVNMTKHDATCQKNGSVEFDLLDENGSHIAIDTVTDKAIGTDLSVIRFYWKNVDNEYDTVKHTTRDAKIKNLSPGTYIVGVQAQCHVGGSGESAFEKKVYETTITIQSLYSTPVVERLGVRASYSYSSGWRPSLPCQATGRIQLRITGNSFPYYISVYDINNHDTVRVDTFYNFQYQGNNINRFDYRYHYTIDSLAAGTYRLFFRDGCSTIDTAPSLVQTIEEVNVPMLTNLSCYRNPNSNANHDYFYFSDINITKGNIEDYLYEEYSKLLQYRVCYGDLDTSDWKPFPMQELYFYTTEQDDSYHTYSNLRDTAYGISKLCELQDKYLTFQYRYAPICGDTSIINYYSPIIKSNANLSYYTTNEVLDYTGVQYDSCGYTIPYVHSYTPYIYGYIGNNGSYTMYDTPQNYYWNIPLVTTPLYWSLTDGETQQVVKEAVVSNYGEWRISMDDLQAYYGILRDTSLNLKIKILDENGCTTTSTSYGVYIHNDTTDHHYTWNNWGAWHAWGSECCNSQNGIRMREYLSTEQGISCNPLPELYKQLHDGTQYKITRSPRGNKYNFTATYHYATDSWEIVKDSITNNAEVVPYFERNTNQFEWGLDFKDYCLPEGYYDIQYLTHCDTFSTSVYISGGYQIKYDKPVFELSQVCDNLDITLEAGAIKKQIIGSDTSLTDQPEKLHPEEVQFTRFRIISGPEGGYPTDYYQLGETIQLSIPGTYTLRMENPDESWFCDNEVYYDTTITYTGGNVTFKYATAYVCDADATQGDFFCLAENGTAPYTYSLYSGTDLEGDPIATNSNGIFKNLENFRAGMELSISVGDACGRSFNIPIIVSTLTQSQLAWFDGIEGDTRTASVCEGNSIDIYVSAFDEDFTYHWTGPNGFEATTKTGHIVVERGYSSGFYNVEIGNSGCAATIVDSVELTVLQAPRITVSENQTVCPGEAVTLNFTPTAGQGYIYYTITKEENSITEDYNFSSSLNWPSTLTYEANSKAHLWVKRVSDVNCSYTLPEDTVTVNLRPAASACDVTVNNPTVCYGTGATLNASSSLNPPYTLKWYSDSLEQYLIKTEIISSETGTSQFTLNNLIEDTTLYVTVQNETHCETHIGTISRWFNMNEGTTEMTCGESIRLFDAGGIYDDYRNNEYITHTFTAPIGNTITISFNSFYTQENGDVLRIYSGTEPLQSNFITSFSGYEIPETVTSVSNSMTIVFVSNGSIEYEGWDAVVSCSAGPAKAHIYVLEDVDVELTASPELPARHGHDITLTAKGLGGQESLYKYEWFTSMDGQNWTESPVRTQTLSDIDQYEILNLTSSQYVKVKVTDVGSEPCNGTGEKTVFLEIADIALALEINSTVTDMCQGEFPVNVKVVNDGLEAANNVKVKLHLPSGMLLSNEADTLIFVGNVASKSSLSTQVYVRNANHPDESQTDTVKAQIWACDQGDAHAMYRNWNWLGMPTEDDEAIMTITTRPSVDINDVVSVNSQEICYGAEATFAAVTTSLQAPVTFTWYGDDNLSQIIKRQTITSGPIAISTLTMDNITRNHPCFVSVQNEAYCPAFNTVDVTVKQRTTPTDTILMQNGMRIVTNQDHIMLYDDGGPDGYYQSNQQLSYLFKSADGSKIILSFDNAGKNSLSSNGLIEIFEGEDVLYSPCIAAFSWSNMHGQIVTSNSGKMLVRFTSGDYSSEGFSAHIFTNTREEVAEASVTFKQPIAGEQIATSGAAVCYGSDATLSASSQLSGEKTYYWYDENMTLVKQDVTTGVSTIISQNVTKETPFYVTISGADECATIVNNKSVSLSSSSGTTIVAAGQPISIFDNGGPAHDYPYGSSYYRHTFTAEEGQVSLAITSLDTKSNDWINIYDGTSTDNNIAAIYYNGIIGDIYTSTSGSLTVVWDPSQNNSGSGFEGVVSLADEMPVQKKTVLLNESNDGNTTLVTPNQVVDFYDEGGQSSFTSHNYSHTFTTLQGNIQVHFYNYIGLNESDTLYVYDGDDNASPLLAKWSGYDYSSYTMTSTGKSLTFVLHGNENCCWHGWNAQISNVNALNNMAEVMASVKTPMDGSNITTTNAEVCYGSNAELTATSQVGPKQYFSWYDAGGNLLKSDTLNQGATSILPIEVVWGNYDYFVSVSSDTSCQIVVPEQYYTSNNRSTYLTYNHDGNTTTVYPYEGVTFNSVNRYQYYLGRTLSHTFAVQQGVVSASIRSYNMPEGDTLCAYDGPDANAALLGKWYGTKTGNTYENVVSSSKTMTFVFKSGPNSNNPSWSAAIRSNTPLISMAKASTSVKTLSPSVITTTGNEICYGSEATLTATANVMYPQVFTWFSQDRTTILKRDTVTVEGESSTLNVTPTTAGDYYVAVSCDTTCPIVQIPHDHLHSVVLDDSEEYYFDAFGYIDITLNPNDSIRISSFDGFDHGYMEYNANFFSDRETFFKVHFDTLNTFDRYIQLYDDSYSEFELSGSHSNLDYLLFGNNLTLYLDDWYNTPVTYFKGYIVALTPQAVESLATAQVTFKPSSNKDIVSTNDVETCYGTPAILTANAGDSYPQYFIWYDMDKNILEKDTVQDATTTASFLTENIYNATTYYVTAGTNDLCAVDISRHKHSMIPTVVHLNAETDGRTTTVTPSDSILFVPENEYFNRLFNSYQHTFTALSGNIHVEKSSGVQLFDTDTLYVYDGTDSMSPLLYKWIGRDYSYHSFTSQSGSLTFVLKGSGVQSTENRTGWRMSITIEELEELLTSVRADVKAPVSPDAITVTDGEACYGSDATLSASSQLSGEKTYFWYDENMNQVKTETVTDEASTFTVPSVTGESTYYVTVGNGTECPARTDDGNFASVHANVKAPVSPDAITVTDGEACYGSDATLSASSQLAFPQHYTWYAPDRTTVLKTETIDSGNSTLTVTNNQEETYYVTVYCDTTCPVFDLNTHSNTRTVYTTDGTSYENVASNDSVIFINENMCWGTQYFQSNEGSSIHIHFNSIDIPTGDEYYGSTVSIGDAITGTTVAVVEGGHYTDLDYVVNSNNVYVSFFTCSTYVAPTWNAYVCAVTPHDISVLTPVHTSFKRPVSASQITTENGTACYGESTTLSASSAIDYPQYYNWYDSNYNFLYTQMVATEGEKSQYEVSQVKNTSQYYVSVYNNDECPVYVPMEIVLNEKSDGLTTMVTEHSPVRFYDAGGKNNSYNGRNGSFTHVFTNPNGQVYMSFADDMRLAYNDILYVYDGTSESSIMLYAINNDNIGDMPQTFQSSNGSLFVKFEQQGNCCYDGWRALVTATPRQDNSVVLLSPSTNGKSTLLMPGDEVGFYDEGGKNGSIGYYSNELLHTFTAMQGVLQVSFNECVQVGGCTLSVYDGATTDESSLLGSWSSDCSYPTFISTGNSLTFKLSPSYSGFWWSSGWNATISTVASDMAQAIASVKTVVPSSITTTNAEVCYGSEATFTASVDMAYPQTFYWFSPDRMTLLKQETITSGNSSLTVLPNEEETYYVTVTNDSTCPFYTPVHDNYIEVNMGEEGATTNDYTLSTNDSIGFFDAGGRNGNYNQSWSGHYYFRAPEGSHIRMHLDTMQLDNNGNARMEIYNRSGHPVASLRGSKQDYDFVMEDNYMQIYFYNWSSNTYMGWEGYIYAIMPREASEFAKASVTFKAPVAESDISVQDALVCYGSEATLTATSSIQYPQSYTWFAPDRMTVLKEETINAGSSTLTVPGDEFRTYYVAVTNNTNCPIADAVHNHYVEVNMGTTDYTQNIVLATNDSVGFFDAGGKNADYNNSWSGYSYFQTEEGNRIRIHFDTIALANSNAYLRIRENIPPYRPVANLSGPLHEANLDYIVEARSLEVYFSNFSSTTDAGWEGYVYAVTPHNEDELHPATVDFIVPELSQDVTVESREACYGENITLTATSAVSTPQRFAWYDKDLNLLKVEETSGTSTLDVLATESTKFFVYASAVNECPILPPHFGEVWLDASENGKTTTFVTTGDAVNFYDAGGPDAQYYTPGADWTHTFVAPEGEQVTLHLDYFNSNCGHRLEIYDGTTTDYLLNSFSCCCYNNWSYTSSTGALTVRWIIENEGNNFNYDGWSALVGVKDNNGEMTATAVNLPFGTVTLRPSVAATAITTTNDEVCFGSEATLTASSDLIYPQTYYWYDSDKMTILKQETINEGHSELVIQPSEESSYYVAVTNDNNCPIVETIHNHYVEHLLDGTNSSYTLAPNDSVGFFDAGGRNGDSWSNWSNSYTFYAEEGSHIRVHFDTVMLGNNSSAQLSLYIRGNVSNGYQSQYQYIYGTQGNLDYIIPDNQVQINFSNWSNTTVPGWEAYIYAIPPHNEDELAEATVRFMQPAINNNLISVQNAEGCYGDVTTLSATSSLTSTQNFVWYDSDMNLLKNETVPEGQNSTLSVDVFGNATYYVNVSNADECPILPPHYGELWFDESANGQTTTFTSVGEAIPFYDAGGPNNIYHTPGADWTHTFKAPVGEQVTLQLNSFQADCGNRLSIYDGTSAFGSALRTFECGYYSNESFTSTNGALTVRWKIDYNDQNHNHYAGWDALVGVLDDNGTMTSNSEIFTPVTVTMKQPTYNLPITTIGDEVCYGSDALLTATSPISFPQYFSWYAPDAQTLLKRDTVDGIAKTQSEFPAPGYYHYQDQTYYVAVGNPDNCPASLANPVNTMTVLLDASSHEQTTVLTAFDKANFYDAGGRNSSYCSHNSDYTHTFKATQGRLKVKFTDNNMRIQRGDTLYIYDAEHASADHLLGKISYYKDEDGNYIVDYDTLSFVSSGKYLTFRFVSQGNCETGWNAVITPYNLHEDLATAEVTIRVTSVPESSITTTSTEVCLGQNAEVSASANIEFPQYYVWYDTDMNILLKDTLQTSAETASVLSLPAQYQDATYYALVYSDTVSCLMLNNTIPSTQSNLTLTASMSEGSKTIQPGETINFFSDENLRGNGYNNQDIHYDFIAENGRIRIHFDTLVAGHETDVDFEDGNLEVYFGEYYNNAYHDVTITSLSNRLSMRVYLRSNSNSFAYWKGEISNIGAVNNQVLSHLASANVSVNANNSVNTVVTTNDTVCIGSPATLTASSTDAAYPQFYTWFNNDLSQIVFQDTVQSGISQFYIPGVVGNKVYRVEMHNENVCPVSFVTEHDNVREYLLDAENNGLEIFVAANDSVAIYDNGGKYGNYTTDNGFFRAIILKTYPGATLDLRIPLLRLYDEESYDDEENMLVIAEPDANGQIGETSFNRFFTGSLDEEISFTTLGNVAYVVWQAEDDDELIPLEGFELVATANLQQETRLAKAEVTMKTSLPMSTLALTANPTEATICEGNDLALSATSSLSENPQHFVWYNSDLSSVLATETITSGNTATTTVSGLTQDTTIYVAVGTDEVCPAYPLSSKVNISELRLDMTVNGDTTLLTAVDSVLFYDENGPNLPYSYSSENTMIHHTFKANSGHVKIKFSEMSLTDCDDIFLAVLEGNLDEENIVAYYTADEIGADDSLITSVGNTLTVVWMSDHIHYNEPHNGWKASVYTDELLNADMNVLARTDVTVNSSFHHVIYDTVCASSIPYSIDRFQNIDISTGGEYEIDSVYQTNLGCDSTYSLKLKVVELGLDGIVSTNVSCRNAMDGSITISDENVVGGITPFDFTLTLEGETIDRREQLSPGNYLISVKDRFGCSISETITISQPDELHFTNCPDDLTYNVEIGQDGIEIMLTQPQFAPTDNNPIVTTSGIPSDNYYTVGTHTITYTVTNDCGEEDVCTFTLTVNPATKPITIISNNQSWTYDGYVHLGESFTVWYGDDELTADDNSNGRIFTIPVTGDKLTITPTASVIDFTPTPVTNTFEYVLQNANYYENVTTENGTLSISKRNVSITVNAENASKMYDGDSLKVTFDNIMIDQLADRDQLIAGFVITEGFVVGEYVCSDGNFMAGDGIASQHGFDIVHGDGDGYSAGSSLVNYTPTFDITLRITARPLTITALSDTKVYDGTALTASYELSSTADPILGEGDAVQAETVGSQTCVGTYANTVADGYKVMHTSIVDGVTATEDVTSSYDISTVNGTLTVTPITTGFDCPASLPITLNEGTADTTLTTTQLGTPTLNGSALPDYVTASSDLAAQNPLAEGTHTITWTLRDTCGNAMTTCTQTVEVSYQPCEGTITMANGTYHYKRIGHQCWFTENLREETGEHHAYKDNAANVADYGYLYSWYTTVGVTEGDDNAEPDNTTVGADGQHYVQGICPDGWSVGSASDYATLNAAVPVNLLKDPSTQYWLNGYEGTPGGSGFNARGSGWFNSALNRYEDFKTGFHFWNSDSTPGSSTASAGTVNYYCDSIATETASKRDLRSVRCVRKVNP